jgi:hypothetical protein
VLLQTAVAWSYFTCIAANIYSPRSCNRRLEMQWRAMVAMARNGRNECKGEPSGRNKKKTLDERTARKGLKRE